MAVPFTLVIVPVLLLLTPWSIRRPFRSMFFVFFLLAHGILFFPTGSMDLGVERGYKSLIRTAPSFLAPFLPTPLVNFLCGSQGFNSLLEMDVLTELYRMAEEYQCANGFFFPLFCFLYVPFFTVVFIVSLMLPAQKVEEMQVSAKEVAIYAVSIITLVCGAFTGGVFWRSYSSHGMGNMKWKEWLYDEAATLRAQWSEFEKCGDDGWALGRSWAWSLWGWCPSPMNRGLFPSIRRDRRYSDVSIVWRFFLVESYSNSPCNKDDEEYFYYCFVLYSKRVNGKPIA